MKVIFQIIVLLITSFSGLIVLNNFPTDGLTKMMGFMSIGSIILFIIVIAILLLSRLSKNMTFRYSFFGFLVISTLFLNYKMYPNYKYSPMNLHSEFKELEKSYDTISLKSYSEGIDLTDKIKNKMLRHKYALKLPNYFIKYHDIKNSWEFSKSKSFPIWIINDSILTNNDNLRWELKDSIYSFKEVYQNDSLNFIIGMDGLNRVEHYYTGGGTNVSETGIRTRNSGTVDQNGFRIIVTKNTDDEAYGKDKFLYDLFDSKLKNKKVVNTIYSK